MGNPATTPPANTATSTPRIVRFGLFELDLRSHELRRKGLKIKLQEQPCHILAILLEHPGEVITREELRNALWPSDTFVDFNHSLNSAIMRLREVLGDSSENPRFIETLSRRGYRFIAPVDETAAREREEHPPGQFSLAPEKYEPAHFPESAGALTPPVVGPPQFRRTRFRKLYKTIAAVMAAALAGGLAFYYAHKSSVRTAQGPKSL